MAPNSFSLFELKKKGFRRSFLKYYIVKGKGKRMKKSTPGKKIYTIKSKSIRPKRKTAAMEAALRKTQNMLEMVINNVPQHIFWKDLNSVFVGCNDNFASAVGLSDPADIKGKTDFDLADEEKARHFIEIDQEVIRKNSPIYNMMEQHRNASGEIVWVNINKVPLHDENGEIVGVLGTFEDISNRVILEKKMQGNAEKYRNLISFTDTAYMILDSKLKIIEANEIFADLLKTTPDKMVGCNPRAWVLPKYIERFDNSFKNVLYGNPIRDLEIDLIDDDGKTICATFNANILENGGVKIFCLIRDISHRKVKEGIEYIHQQKKKDKLKQNIMHLRNSIKEIKSR